MNKHFSSILCKRPSDKVQLSQLIKVAASDIVYMLSHRHLRAKKHAKITYTSRQSNDSVIMQGKQCYIDECQLQSSVNPDDWSFIRIHFQTIGA